MQVIVTESVAEPVQQRLEALDLNVDLLIVSRQGETQADLITADALLRESLSRGGYDRVLAAAPGLRWIHSASAGVESMLSDDISRRGIVFTNSAGVYALPIAEWVMHALLMIVKRGAEMIDAQRERRWHDAPDFDELSGKTLTILGAGGIGQAIAQRAAAFDMRVWGINRTGRPVPHVDRVISGDDWRDALRETDFLVLAAPLTEATRAMIGARELAMLPTHAWLINIARGALVDEAALIDVLEQGALGGAALDTFVEEPLPPTSPFWTLPNVIISPHHSGSSPRSTERMIDLFIDNLRRFVHGQELINVVDLQAGY